MMKVVCVCVGLCFLAYFPAPIAIPVVVSLFLGTLHVGDEIKEINGISVARQSVENLQAILVCH